MDEHARGRAVRCGWCHAGFVVCAQCDPAKWRRYCGDKCAGEAARHAQRLRDQRYQASDEWREDHRAFMSALRARETKDVIVGLCAISPRDAIVCATGDSTPTGGVSALRGEEHGHGSRGDGDDGADAKRDAIARDGRTRRGDEGPARAGRADAPAGGPDAAGGDCALVPAESPRCHFCGRRCRPVGPRLGGRAWLWGRDRALRRRMGRPAHPRPHRLRGLGDFRDVRRQLRLVWSR